MFLILISFFIAQKMKNSILSSTKMVRIPNIKAVYFHSFKESTYKQSTLFVPLVINISRHFPVDANDIFA